MGSRGCPYRCSYCAKEMQGGYRARPVPKILEELKALKARGVTHLSFTDETFTLKKARVLELCREMASRGLGMRWTCQTRAELLDDELMRAMKEAGCTWIGVGFESASEEVRERAGKKIVLDDVRRAVELGKRHGVTVNLFMISFLPGETYATLDESLEFVRQEKPPLLSTVIATPIPGTRLWEEGLASGVLERGDWEECLRKAGRIGTGFTAEEIEEYSRVYTAELSLYGGLIGYKLKALLGNPRVLPHFFSMLLFYLRYRMKKLYKGRGKGGREAKA
ncbi:MAG: radical SAM protein [Candidatus Hydrothermarchaeota archaeon]